MSEITAIEWCTSTWNPWQGCTNVSPGCDLMGSSPSTQGISLDVVPADEEARASLIVELLKFYSTPASAPNQRVVLAGLAKGVDAFVFLAVMMMNSMVVMTSCQLKIFRRVVCFVAVNVMNFLSFTQEAAEFLFHHHTVLIHIAPAIRCWMPAGFHEKVAIRCKCPAPGPPGIFRVCRFTVHNPIITCGVLCRKEVMSYVWSN